MHNFSCYKCEFLFLVLCEQNSFSLIITGVQSVDIKLQSEQVIVKTSLPTDVIKSMIESTGRVAVLQGFGGTSGE